MVTQYPHTLTVTTKVEAARDVNGNWVPGSETSTDYSCRAEPASGNASIPGDDGNRIYYDWTVYLPLPVPDMMNGAVVTVKDGIKVLSNNKIKRFNRGQLNARIWL